MLDAGDYVEAIIDTPDPDAKPIPRPDVRRMLVPIGPVAVFGASNFPLAFSTAGGDTASALAAGCPVVVKGHPSHPGTGELVARELRAAVADAGLPEGTFAHLLAAGVEVGEALVDAPAIAAVGFTGSTAGGRAIVDRAARRPQPIPVYAEMGSINPIVVTDAALAARARGDRRRARRVACRTSAASCAPSPASSSSPPARPATRSRRRSPRSSTASSRPCCSTSACATRSPPRSSGSPGRPDVRAARQRAARSTARASATSPPRSRRRPRPSPRARALLEEHFGPVVVLLRYARPRRAARRARRRSRASSPARSTRSRTTTPSCSALLTELLAARAGRVVYDGFPTGVAVTHGMHHGGPYPATSAPAHTSVGMTAIRRFLRPVAWQNAPAAVLPPELRDGNPLGIWRRRGRRADARSGSLVNES